MSQLQKSLRLPQIISLYIGAVLGSGVLFLPGVAASMSGPLSIVSWIVISLAAVPLALTMGLLSAFYPSSGGVSHFVSEAFGKSFGTVIGWMFLLSVPTGVPIIALTGSSYLGQLFGWGHSGMVLGAAAILATVLMINFFGVKTMGFIQTLVISLILFVLLFAIFSSLPHVKTEHFTPFAPNGIWAAVPTIGILFWCFIGWESVTHMSGEFNDPGKDALKGVFWSAGIVSVLYIMLGVMVVGTGSYTGGMAETALSHMVQLSFGKPGAIGVSITALFISIASANAYVSAGSRIAYTLSQQRVAPRWFGTVHSNYKTPIGGLLFIGIIFAVLLTAVHLRWLSFETLLPFPNATYFATYIGGAAAGVKLLKNHKIGRIASMASLVLTLGFFPFLGWVALYPVSVVLIVFIWNAKKKTTQTVPLNS
ncbi:amino acid permease [Rossellomorea aquimaris]|uniref:APC family permease n=1 Tax=Rossellomorea aquimaris TaxID=189382 RepID=UPI001CD42616|nr:amino acid permease [Rossellomorea aquimaris]MCA1061217.1 amino acid permease [Rossellomorea aquimaris]